MLIVLIGPSGSGKTTLERKFVKQFGFDRIVSHTTRKPRPGEIDGVDYYFVSEDEFNQIEMLEFVEYNGNLYGASVQEFQKKARRNCVFVAEPHGAKQAKLVYPYAKLVYLWVPEEIRFQRMLESRGPVEARLRIQADRLVFMGAETLADYIVPNYCHSPEWTAGQLFLNLLVMERTKKKKKKKVL